MFLLKYMGVSIEGVGAALKSEEKTEENLRETLEKLLKRRDKLERQISVAQMLTVFYGDNLFVPDEELDETTARVLNEVLREAIEESAER